MGTPANTTLAYSNSQDNLAILKTLFSDDSWVMRDLVFNKNKFLSMVDKDETEMGLGGSFFPIPVLYDVGGGGSANLGNAQTYQTAPATAQFQLTTVNVYRVGSIQKEFLRASRSKHWRVHACSEDEREVSLYGSFKQYRLSNVL